MIHLKNGSIVPVDKSELPIKLPEDIDLNKGGNPLENHKSWKYTIHKKTGNPAVRETDTLDTFVDSSWYFLRFCSPMTKTEPFDIKKVKELFEKSKGVNVLDTPAGNIYPMPITAKNSDQVFVGRIRRDFTQAKTLNIWVVSDNLRKGAATNTIQIAEYMLSKKLI